MRRRVLLAAIAVPAILAAAHNPGHTATLTTAIVAGTSETAYFRAVLTDMHAPATEANLASLEAWRRHEYPAWPASADNNPLNTTMPAAGATVFNSVGVRNYASASQGAAATAATVANGHYPHIAAALHAGRGVCGLQFAGEFLTWSGSHGYKRVC